MTTTRSPTNEIDGDAALRVARVGDRAVAYAEYGDPDGTPLLFLHGTPGSRLLGRLLNKAAREHEVRVLAPDRPGYGASDPWPDRTVGETVDALVAVLDDADVASAGLVAFSGGAPYALAAATRHPERFDRLDVVSGAVPPTFSDETPPVQRLLHRMARSTPALLQALLRGQAWLSARLDPAAVVAQYTTDGADDVPEDAAAIVKADFLEAIGGDAAAAAVEFRHAARWDPATDGPPIAVRFRHGSRDANVPIDGARRFADQFPGAAFDEYEGADHLGALLRAVPDVVNMQRDEQELAASLA
ncbi:alpha/beta fold hydrolase [Halobellus sp. EA9]|uniref:alpha/beta fold hydrolase n=1 Tax=Halobellus sp. EA9 TaxID=3421647 RepID=UPI003EBAF5EF